MYHQTRRPLLNLDPDPFMDNHKGYDDAEEKKNGSEPDQGNTRIAVDAENCGIAAGEGIKREGVRLEDGRIELGHLFSDPGVNCLDPFKLFEDPQFLLIVRGLDNELYGGAQTHNVLHYLDDLHAVPGIMHLNHRALCCLYLFTP